MRRKGDVWFDVVYDDVEGLRGIAPRAMAILKKQLLALSQQVPEVKDGEKGELDGTADDGNTTQAPEQFSSCTKTVQPNKLVFFDKSGERHEIYLPKGTLQKAIGLLQEENWDELLKFPPYNQNYPSETSGSDVKYISTGVLQTIILLREIGADLARSPQNLSWAESSAIPLSAQTALQALFVQSGIGELGDAAWKGKRVLVTAASGGVGIWVVQLARLAGATVIGTCGPRNVEFVKSFGASEVINYRERDLKEWGQRMGNQVDLVVDCIGKKSLEDAWWCVKDGGILISIFQPPEQVQPEECKRKNVQNLFFIVSANRADLEEVTKLVEEGKCRGVVDSVWPLEQFEEAFKRLDDGHARGKIILDLSLNQ
ncbi:hypothetical protein CNMCM5623_000455 [Aspergillus felis]|uniref:Enoyl reductase (ER) domain-containing protein n=1 Tax=Aspergillus felis TaxID=1287682 RepID=A0A8H6UU01_9EURO|nr:hypothetical protein CNMCM5623_000455 [Aspergillus felis]